MNEFRDLKYPYCYSFQEMQSKIKICGLEFDYLPYIQKYWQKCVSSPFFAFKKFYDVFMAVLCSQVQWGFSITVTWLQIHGALRCIQIMNVIKVKLWIKRIIWLRVCCTRNLKITFAQSNLTAIRFPDIHARWSGDDPKLSGFWGSNPEYMSICINDGNPL